MGKIILLDSGPLGVVTNPNAAPETLACNQWVRAQIKRGAQVLVPEICDYEVRRELLRARKIRSLIQLEKVKRDFGYLPLTTSVMLKAAEFWAVARQTGQPTGHDQALDGDVILAAQAALLIAVGHEVIVATNNIIHLARFVPAARWQVIP